MLNPKKTVGFPKKVHHNDAKKQSHGLNPSADANREQMEPETKPWVQTLKADKKKT